MWFRNLKKQTKPATNPAITVPLVSQVPQRTIDSIVKLAEAIMGIDPNSLEVPLLDKWKGNELSADHDTSVALARAIMLPGDVIAISEETLETVRSLLVIQHVQSLQRAMVISDRMAEHSIELKRANKASPRLYLQDCYPSSKQESATPYSPMILPNFDEEEYINRQEDDEDVLDPVPNLVVAQSDKAATLVDEAGGTIVEASGEKSAKETGGGDGEDTSRDPPLEL
ncbi:hypothetical protein Acr_15g0019520 [Actinidia rufa]|uniref:Uncharacterized protein n=1 Tax=Actinidia rufa TaxID=165716 RepID=A0A7J0FXN6_9ERIC|nr:hypothetical protein Acr_15g0019520 [Actinidia rufa]